MNRWQEFETSRQILTIYNVFGVVGCSSDPRRPSYGVSRYLQSHGYTVVPINPHEDDVHGQTAYPDLRSASRDKQIEVVDIFRRSDAVMEHVIEAIDIGARAVWMQLGVIDEEAAERAEKAGLAVVMDRCPAIDHPRLA